MDEEPLQQPLAKKNKLIAKKNRIDNKVRPSSAPAKIKSNVLREFSKKVNMKNKVKSLDQKQKIFHKIV